MTDSARIAFAPHFTVRVLDERRILLASEERSFLLSGRLYVALVPYLDGTRSVEQIIAALAPSAPVERIKLALSNLLDKKYAAEVAVGAPIGRAAFWSELGLEAAAAERRVRDTTVAVRAFGERPGADGSAAGQLLAALAEIGFTLAGESTPDVTVALVDDYLQPALAAFNAAMRAAGRRWLPVKPAGRILWLGPMFGSADAACWTAPSSRWTSPRWHSSVTSSTASPRARRAASGPIPRACRRPFVCNRGPRSPAPTAARGRPGPPMRWPACNPT